LGLGPQPNNHQNLGFRASTQQPSKFWVSCLNPTTIKILGFVPQPNNHQNFGFRGSTQQPSKSWVSCLNPTYYCLEEVDWLILPKKIMFC
jgi:hypothetical protein